MLRFSFFRYGIIGILSVCVDFLFLFIFFDIFNFPQSLAVSIGFIISAIFNFLMHKNYTFKTNSNNIINEIVKYILLITVSYFITLFLIIYLVDIGLNLYFSKLCTICIVYIYGYVFGKYFVFKGHN